MALAARETSAATWSRRLRRSSIWALLCQSLVCLLQCLLHAFAFGQFLARRLIQPGVIHRQRGQFSELSSDLT